MSSVLLSNLHIYCAAVTVLVRFSIIMIQHACHSNIQTPLVTYMSPKLVKTAIYYLYALAEPVLKFTI